MAIPRNLANLANQLDTSGNPPKVQVGDSSVVVSDTGSNGTITFTTDNAERMRVTAAGNVGIGTNSPNISGGSAGTTALTLSATSSGRNAILELNGTRTGSNQISSYLRFFNNTGASPLVDILAYRESSDTDGTLAFVVSGTERMRLPSAGGVQCKTTLSVGDATPSTSGAGITFPATQSASSNANTLDDYEEGTFNVTDASGAGLTFTNNTARYTKIGRLVTVEIRNLTFPSTASGANVVLGGLPFTVGSTSDSVGACINNTGTTVIESLALNSSTTMYLYQGTSFTQIINSDLSLKSVYFTITYSV